MRLESGAGGGAGARRRLPAGDVLFEKVRVLQASELDRDAVLEMAYHPSQRLADGDGRADLGQLVGRIARCDTAVAAVCGQAEDMAVGEPGELGGELVALAHRRRDRHGKAI